MSRSAPKPAAIRSRVEALITSMMPPGWAFTGSELTAPTGERLRLTLEVQPSPEPREVARIVERLAPTPDGTVRMVASGYLSPRSRQLLEANGIAYADSTGNMHLTASTPGLFVRNLGADKNPWPPERELSSLKGKGSAKAVRAIVAACPPFGVRELAGRSAASPASISRTAELLEREALITRGPRGEVTAVDWRSVIHRWAQDYDQLGTNGAISFLAPRGLPALREGLTNLVDGYAATGAFAAQGFGPVAPARTAALYAPDPYDLAAHLGLREVDAGANVVLLDPYDPIVFSDTITKDGLIVTALPQLAVDLLTGPGREPAEGESVLDWMERNESTWRS